MKSIYKSAEGERAIRERYIEMLKHWPVPNRQLRVPTREGETFVVASGPESAPPLVLLHGGMANSAMWMGDVAAWAAHFRVYAVDLIGEAGLSAPSRPRLQSEAHAFWLDDVMRELGLSSASLVGVSLGGWLALDYATRRPLRVDSLSVICPAGVGRQRISIVFKTIPLRFMGRWGSRKASELVLGKGPANPSPALRYFMSFVALIHRNFRARVVKLPVFSDSALRRLNMPVMAIVGGQDVLFDSAETRRRLEANVPGVEIRFYPEAGHLIPGQTAATLDFLRRATALSTRNAVIRSGS
jgi:pimeloyl-ACP methyl ester carboxylesterase